ncbi:unnamed protein product [Ilex paraguariensis]|uniref:Uncharacterized protein n=1 Tax=Ilex paraguariensis TaxID=185542 RepID=A0ABC8R5Q8_9AQUA
MLPEEAAREANERAEVAEATLIELIKGLEEAISETRAALSTEEELKKKLDLEDSFPAKEGAVVEAES